MSPKVQIQVTGFCEFVKQEENNSRKYVQEMNVWHREEITSLYLKDACFIGSGECEMWMPGVESHRQAMLFSPILQLL